MGLFGKKKKSKKTAQFRQDAMQMYNNGIALLRWFRHDVPKQYVEEINRNVNMSYEDWVKTQKDDQLYLQWLEWAQGIDNPEYAEWWKEYARLRFVVADEERLMSFINETAPGNQISERCIYNYDQYSDYIKKYGLFAVDSNACNWAKKIRLPLNLSEFQYGNITRQDETKAFFSWPKYLIDETTIYYDIKNETQLSVADRRKHPELEKEALAYYNDIMTKRDRLFREVRYTPLNRRRLVYECSQLDFFSAKIIFNENVRSALEMAASSRRMVIKKYGDENIFLFMNEVNHGHYVDDAAFIEKALIELYNKPFSLADIFGENNDLAIFANEMELYGKEEAAQRMREREKKEAEKREQQQKEMDDCMRRVREIPKEEFDNFLKDFMNSVDSNKQDNHIAEVESNKEESTAGKRTVETSDLSEVANWLNKYGKK